MKVTVTGLLGFSSLLAGSPCTAFQLPTSGGSSSIKWIRTVVEPLSMAIIEEDPLSVLDQSNGAGGVPAYEPTSGRPVKMFDPNHAIFGASNPPSQLQQSQQQQQQQSQTPLTVFDPSNLAKQPPSSAESTKQLKRYSPGETTQRETTPAPVSSPVAEAAQASVQQLQMLKQQQEQLEIQQQQLDLQRQQLQKQQEELQMQQQRQQLEQQKVEQQFQMQQQQQQQQVAESPPQQQQQQTAQSPSSFARDSEFDRLDVSTLQNDPEFRRRLNDVQTYWDLFDGPQAEWSSSEYIRREYHRRKKERKRIGHSLQSGVARDVGESETLQVGNIGQKRLVRYTRPTSD